ncbi:uncharacterized protein LOC111383157 [Olea europaea var. sylvestris]|uniref:uncharacterized protein LOC111383157 n=1 Tax=Olea europaea var. sylvestris TaxID=158386 RepID=UPI000C1D560F|nr:uncharacterized protein LOC111383157 [Olea europaea var. sylvestris]
MKFKSSGDGSSSSKARIDSSINKKKLVEKSSSKSELKTKTTSSSSKTVNKTVTKTREKKVFSLPGQKYDVPEEREPLRIFYESLSKQIPSSEMAEFWLMEHGMLSPERARKAFEKKQRKQKQLRMGTPIKSSTTRPSSSSKPAILKKPLLASKSGDAKAKKRILVDSDEEDDFVLSPKRRKG